MAKIAKKYLEVDPWIIEENGFNKERALVSESIFSLANEYMGVRGYFEEGYSGEQMIGAYFNGIYIRGKHNYSTRFRGFAEEYTSMVNAVDWLYTRIEMDGERLDLATAAFSGFRRTLDLRTGILERTLVWKTNSGRSVRLLFRRFLSMIHPQVGAQQIVAEALDFDGALKITLGLDFSIPYYARGRCMWSVLKKEAADGLCPIMGLTEGSGHRVFSGFKVEHHGIAAEGQPIDLDHAVARKFTVSLLQNQPAVINKTVFNHTEKNAGLSDEQVWNDGVGLAAQHRLLSFDQLEREHRAYWEKSWRDIDVSIEGDPENEQGLRFCLFQLHQTYHGVDPHLHIGAKGLTGEHYQGQAFWDTETYCLPFYLFSDRQAGKNLLRYRYNTLQGALNRARQLDMEGARYPMCTIDGEEVCDVWQHGDLQIHVSAAVGYAVMLYDKIIGHESFLYSEGLEMLLQISRFYAARGGWGQRTGKWGYYGVMGADEMHMMVNNSVYTNVMAKKVMEHTLGLVERIRAEAPETLEKVFARVGLREGELEDWRHKAASTYEPRDPETGVYEQFDGYFDMPHLDFHSIPEEQFPLIKNWAYVRRLRFDLIKQPDVLLLPFFFSHDYTDETKKANYGFYEPRCSHESSLSPCIHSILAAELGMHEQAYEYSQYASRIDLDDYNNNTCQGLHVTSMGGAWMNLVYGFGGMRTDGEVLSFRPSLPKKWNSFSFRIFVSDYDTLSIRVDREKVSFIMNDGLKPEIEVFGKRYTVTNRGLEIPMPADRIG
jgi:maltose phosphorylase